MKKGCNSLKGKTKVLPTRIKKTISRLLERGKKKCPDKKKSQNHGSKIEWRSVK